MTPTMGCININQQHKATIKKLVVHYAISERSRTIEREKAFRSTDSILDGGSTGLINSRLCIHPRDVLDEIRANRRTNCHKTHRDFVGAYGFSLCPSKAGNTSDVLSANRNLSGTHGRMGEQKANILRFCAWFFERAQ